MRTLGSNALAASQSEHVTLCLLIELAFDSGVQRYALSGYDVSYGGNTWLAARVSSIEATRESTAPEATALRISITGTFSSYLSQAMSEPIRGRSARLYVAFLNDAGQVLDDPVEEWSGMMDTMSIVDSPNGTSTIVLSLESEAARYNRPRVTRHNDADQQRRWPGDLYYDRLPSMIEATFVFPSREWQARRR